MVVEEGKASVAEDPEAVKSEWFAALRTGDVVKVTELLDKGLVDVNATDEHGWHPIHIAAWNGYTEICSKLIEKDCHFNSPGVGNSTPLTLAAQQGHLTIVKLLIDAKVDVQRSANLGESLNVTALHLAAQNGHTDIVRLLVANGAIVNAQMTVRGIKGVTPLHLAVEAGHLDIMDALIDAGCDIHSSTKPTSESAC